MVNKRFCRRCKHQRPARDFDKFSNGKPKAQCRSCITKDNSLRLSKLETPQPFEPRILEPALQASPSYGRPPIPTELVSQDDVFDSMKPYTYDEVRPESWRLASVESGPMFDDFAMDYHLPAAPVSFTSGCEAESFYPDRYGASSFDIYAKK